MNIDIPYIDIQDIRDAYWAGHYDYKMQIPEVLNPYYVFDDNLSVKKNREMVIEHNNNVEKMREEKRIKSKECRDRLANDVVKYITNTYDINESQARIIERYVYDKEHSYMSCYFDSIEEACELVGAVLSV